ncbi:MAG: Tol-Pal system beta propeller repeat protein TolB [Rhodobacteraceae bacterium]|nr:Tol-Pal system beta propeller repeat protein TolB [Paracoccaceae bacterium]MCY4195368.1 Tol-Pal system beta propeller repeat protein TolB [Paracoccaceae bacterium]MCY4327599.1 Tol-Pal system beta propeller repeat protein TolB [Paracoccaceae bacterium]
MARIWTTVVLVATLVFAAEHVRAQEQRVPLRIVITEGVIEPMPIALPTFSVGNPGDRELASRITAVIVDDLTGTGLFRRISPDAYLSSDTGADSRIRFADWRAINAQALIAGSVVTANDVIEVNFRLFDVFAESEFGKGVRFTSDVGSWRRVAHKIADSIYQRITGELPYFDSQVAFISESGAKGNRIKQLAIMDYDGANARALTDGTDIVLAPRFSPDGGLLIYTSYETGTPSVYLLNLRTGARQAVLQNPDMAFAPRFFPDGGKVVLSLTIDGNTDIFEVELGSRKVRRLTSSAAIDTAPSVSPDGNWIAFESDRSRRQQIYIMRARDGEPRRISFGEGRYGTPVWSPTGDYIAFTKQYRGRFHIGVMRADGSDERILTASFLDEGPTWSPNGRNLMFFREEPGELGGPSIYSVDVYGRNLRRINTPQFGSDPSWSPIRR